MLDVSVTWLSTGSLDEITAVGSSYTFQPVTAPASGRIGAQASGGLYDDTGDINVALGTLSEIRINDAAGSSGVEVGNKILGAGQELELFASGYDADGNYREAITATWGQTGTLDPVSGNSPSISFTPLTAPSSGTIYASGSGFSDTTGVIEVTIESLSYMRLRTEANGLGVVYSDTAMTADDTLILYAAGYDNYNNYLGDQTADWYSTGGLDYVNANGISYTFDPVTAPSSGKIGATNGINAFTGDITVAVGDTNEIRINSSAGPDGEEITTATLVALQLLTLYASAYDQDQNWISGVEAIWSSTGTLDSVGGTGTFYEFIPVTAPSSGTIQADYSNFSDITGLIEVEEGDLDHIRIRTAAGGVGVIVGDTTITADDTMPLFAASYDASNNYLRDLTVSWSSTGTIDNVSGTDSNYIFNPVTAPTTGTIRITSGALSHQTGTITVSVGELDHVTVNDASGSSGVPVDVVAMTADDSRTFYAGGYDSDNNFISNVVATWSRTGTLDPVNGTGTSWIFSPTTAPTSGTIAIAYLSNNDATDTITVSPGALSSVKVNASAGAGGIEVGLETLSVGQNLTVYAAGYDQYGNYRGLEEAAWQTTPSLDSQTDLGESFTFTPLTANTSGTIVAALNGYNDATGTITVEEGSLTYVKIRTGANGTGVEFSGTDMTADQTLILYAAGYDAGNNYLEDVSVTWTSIGSLDAISHTGPSLNFSPTTAPTQGIIRAQTGSIIDETGTINVTNGVAATIIDYAGLSGERTTVSGSTQWIRVKVVDQHGNNVTGTTVSFSPANRMSDATDITDAGGLAETVYTTPRDENQTTVQASVTGLDPFIFTIYGIRYVSDPGLYPKVVQRGANASFTITISNPGNVAVPLNISATNLRFSGGGYSYSATLQSPSILPANNMSITLTYNTETVSAEFPGGAYTPDIQMVGSGSFSSMNGTFTTSPGELTIGDENVTMSSVQIIGLNPESPSDILQGDQGIIAKMIVLNVGIALPIDPFPTTSIYFKYMDNTPFPVSNLQRTDDLTVLESGVQSEITFTFDVPTGNNPGEINVFARLSLDGGNLIKDPIEPSGSFQLLSAGALEYVENSLTPDEVIPRESIFLRAKFINTGSANIVLDKDRSSIEILGTSIGSRNLITHYTLEGLETTEIFFQQMPIPAGLSPGDYDVSWDLHGSLTNGFPYDSIAVIEDGLTVIPAANLVFSKILIEEDTVRQGQTNVMIDYQIRNVGGSDANISTLEHKFKIAGGALIPANEWIATDLDPDLPSILGDGESRSYKEYYTLIQEATTGAIQPVPVVHYNDTRTPSFQDESGTIQQNDVVYVIKPASIKIVNLESLAPNDRTVNVGQNYNMRLAVENTGADRIRMARLHIFNNDQELVKEFEINDIAPGAQKDHTFSLSSTKPGLVIYTAYIDTALDMIDNPVVPEQPDDRDEVITYQLPSRLEIDAVIAAHDSLSDSLIVAVDQIFDVRAQITNLGESAFKEDGLGSLVIHLPKNLYVFSNPFSDSIRNFTATDTIVEWTVRATNVSAPLAYESIAFAMMNVPIDKNTNAAVQDINIIDNTVHVRNEEKGTITFDSLYIDSPDGAKDGTLSTGQHFIIKADISFNFSMALEGRTAELTLPFEFELDGEDNFLVNLSEGEPAEWMVYAPERDRDWSNIKVAAKGIDKNSGNPVQLKSDDLAVKVVDRATLQMSLGIEKISGMGDTLSVDQEFKLNVRVTREGTAMTVGAGTVYLDGIADEPAVSLIGQDTLISFNVGETVFWNLKTNDILLTKSNLQEKISEFLNEYKIESGFLPGKEGLQKPVSEKTRILSSEITDLIQESFDHPTELIVRMIDHPDDENTNSDAFTMDTVKIKTIYIQQAARITISDPDYPDTVSTSQIFDFIVSVNDENNLTEAVGILNLPESFVGANGGAQLFTVPDLDSNRAVWQVRVPDTEEYSGAGQESLSVQIIGVDGNTDQEVFSNPINNKVFTIQLQPRIKMVYEIIEPISARDVGRVSHGQALKVNVWAEFVDKPIGSDLDYAGTESWGTIELDQKLFTDYGFKKVDGQQDALNFTTIGELKQFVVRAPAQNRTALVNFKFSKLPNDKNSGEHVRVEAEGSTVSIPISVAEKKIVVTMLPDLIESFTFPRGEDFHPLMTFEISNEGYQDSLIFNRIDLKFLARTDTSILGKEGILDLIESISIMDYEAAQNVLNKPTGVTYVNHIITETNAANPLKVEFDIPGLLGANEAITVMVLVRFKAGESSRSFRAALTNIFAYNIDADSPVTMVDADGQSILNNADFITVPISVISNDPEKTFGNFPNPFGRPPHETTQIRFLLLKDADVSLRVFSLAGELVRSTWNKSLTNLEEGLYYVTWNGANDFGDRVLNGVYLCAIEITNSSGTHRYMTKIAYIK